MRYYVYELIDPRDGLAFYVGKGCKDRISQHEVQARAGRVSRKCDRIREIEAQGYAVAKKKVKHFHDEIDAYLFEADLIASYGIATLTNVQHGGGGRRNAGTLGYDRARVRAASEMIARCGDGKIVEVIIAGQRMDLRPIIQDFKRSVASVIARRGHEWVNAIAKKWRLEYAVGAPV